MASKSDYDSMFMQLHVNITYYEQPNPEKYKKDPDSDYFTSSSNLTMVTPRQKQRWKSYPLTKERRERIDDIIQQMYDAVEQILEENDEA